MNFQIARKDLWSFEYKRNVHLVALLCVFAMDLVDVMMSLTMQNGVGMIGWLIGGVLFIAFWCMRALEGHDECFPAFHYVTLTVEYVFHCVCGVYNISMFMFAAHMIIMEESKLETVLNFVYFVFYTLLLVYLSYKMAPAVITLCNTDAEQLKRLQLDDEVRGRRPDEVATIMNNGNTVAVAITNIPNSNESPVPNYPVVTQPSLVYL